MSIPISRPIIGEEEIEATVDVLRSGMLAGGPSVSAFEEAFAEYCSSGEGVAVGSGTAALVIGLLAAGVGPGDEVIVPSFTFAATANAVSHIGATPVFADVDPVTYCLTAADVEPHLTPRTRAIMPVHLFGHPAPCAEIRQLVADRNILLFEDAAQAHGATYGSETVGSMGEFAAFSFYPTKNMTTGEGGMITTSNPELARMARIYRNQGMEERYVHDVIGLNERMTAVEGAIGLIQLRNLPGWTKQRQAHAEFYAEHLPEAVNVPQTAPDATHVYHQYTIRPPDRDAVIAAFEEHGIGYGIYYPIPTHRQKPFANLQVSLPVTERLASEVLSIPVRPDLTADELSLIAEVVTKAVS